MFVIDDDEIMRDLVADWLEAAGYEVRKTLDCRLGLAEIDRAEPALVVTDISMPGPGAARLIRELRRKHPGIQIIAISGRFNSGHGLSAQGALALGASRALAKPLRRRELTEAVAELIGVPQASPA